jgi:hypothetical protein
LRDTAKVRLLTLANLDNRTRSARTAHHMVEAFERALGARYSPTMKPLVEAAACAAAIAADLQTRMIAGDASVSVNDVVRAVNSRSRCGVVRSAAPSAARRACAGDGTGV